MRSDGTLSFDTRLDTAGYQSGIDKIKTIGKGAVDVTAKVLKAASAAISAVGGYAVKVGSDFEASMDNVSAISGRVADEDLPAVIATAGEMGLSFKEGADATETAMNILAAKAEEMGAKTKFSASESADAMSYMAMAGWKAEQMLDGIEGIMNLAAASGENLATTSDIVTDALTAFGMKAEESSHFADILAAASSNSNTNVAMMGETFKYAAPIMGAMGYSAEDAAVAIGLMANSGIKASQAGTTLRSILTNLADPSEDAAEAMDALGVSLQDSEGNAYSFMDIMKQLRSGFGDLKISEEELAEKMAELDAAVADGTMSTSDYDDAVASLIERAYGAEGAMNAQYASMLAGRYGMSGLLAIINATDEEFDSLTTAIENADGAAAGMAATMVDNLQGSVKLFTSALEGLGIKIYNSFEEPMKEAVDSAQGYIVQLTDALEAKGLSGMVDEAGQIFADIAVKAAEAGPTIVEAAVQLVASFCESIRDTKGIGEAGVSLIQSLISGLLSIAGELGITAINLIGQFGQAIMASAPAMMDSAIALVGNLTTYIRDNLPQIIPVALEAVESLSGGLRENVGRIVDAGLELIMALGQSLISGIPSLIETVPTIVTNIAGIINDNAPKIVAAGLQLVVQLGAGIIKAIPTLVANIPQIITAIVAALMAFNWVNLGSNIIKFIGNGVRNLASALPNALKNIGKTAAEWLQAINWATLGQDIIDLIVIGVQSLMTAVPNALHAIGTSAMNAMKGINWLEVGAAILGGIWQGLQGMAGWFTEQLTSIGGIVSQFLIDIGQAITDWFTALPEMATEFFASMMTTVSDSLASLGESISAFLTDLPYKVGYALGTALGNIVKFGSDVLTWATANVPNIIASIANFFSELPGKIWKWLVDTIQKVGQWGADTLERASRAARDTIDTVVNFFSELPERTWSWLTETVAKVISFGADLVGRGKSAAQEFFDGIIGIVSRLPGEMISIGSNIVSGVWEGIQSAAGWFLSSVTGFFSGIVDGVKGALGIASPSKVMDKEIGRFIPPGIGQGVTKAMPKLLDEVDAEMDRLADHMHATAQLQVDGFSAKQEVVGMPVTAPPGPVDNRAFNQTVNIYSPTKSPVETARELKKVSREVAYA